MSNGSERVLEFPEPVSNEFRGLTHSCIDPDCHVPDFILSLSDRDDMTIVLDKVTGLTDKVQEFIDLIEPMQEEISPLLDKIAASSMFKMITAGSDS